MLSKQKKSYTILHHTQEHASRIQNYNSTEIRKILTEACLERCRGHPPYPWQLDAAKAFHLGLDCIILAGTGCGKSLPFVMPTMLCKDKILLVISPLNSLEEDQVRWNKVMYLWTD
jgi:ATP-dependent helicase YprA (DUF1998 family)